MLKSQFLLGELTVLYISSIEVLQRDPECLYVIPVT